MKPNAEVWTSVMDTRLRVLWRQGLHDAQIAIALPVRSRWAVAWRRRQLGLPGNHTLYRHSPETRERIRQGNFRKWADPVLAKAMLAGLAKGRKARWEGWQ
jgi:hypothetical protein